MADLKRDIKKLQRFREDIMKWISNPEVKDKMPLQDARRRIEIEMERFKAFERESKTKPFSLVGLAMGGRLDAHEQKKQEKREQLEEVVETLSVQADEFRAEWESLTAKKKKSKDECERIDELKRYIDWHAFHLRSLEQVLRRLDNDVIDPDELDTVIESLAMYVEQFEDPDYYHDEGLYEQFSLDSDAVDATYYKPSLEETSDELKLLASGSNAGSEMPKVREAPLTAAAKAKAKKQAAREIEAAQSGGPVRPDHPGQQPPKPQRPATPTIAPPALPLASNPPNRPAPILAGVVSAPAPQPAVNRPAGVWSSSEPSTGVHVERPPPPPPPSQAAAHGRLGVLEQSYQTRALCQDFVRARPYAPSNPYVHSVAGRSVFPECAPNADEAELMRKLPIDAIVFMFYYREGTYAQFLASQELKRQSWRFHKKFGVWFKRVDGGVKAVNPAFEYGSYLYFDVSGENWGIKTKNDFTFEYEYLEEDSIPLECPVTPELSIRRPLIAPIQPQPLK